jgi:hypothetical protein
VYTDEFNREVITNQYTITERFRPLSLPDANGVMVIIIIFLYIILFYISILYYIFILIYIIIS